MEKNIYSHNLYLHLSVNALKKIIKHQRLVTQQGGPQLHKWHPGKHKWLVTSVPSKSGRTEEADDEDCLLVGVCCTVFTHINTVSLICHPQVCAVGFSMRARLTSAAHVKVWLQTFDFLPPLKYTWNALHCIKRTARSLRGNNPSITPPPSLVPRVRLCALLLLLQAISFNTLCLQNLSWRRSRKPETMLHD